MSFQMRFHFLKILCIGVFLFSISFLQAKDILPRPLSAVADLKGLLSDSEKQALESKLKVFNDTSSSAIVVVIDGTTEGEDIFDYSYKLASNWGIGDKNKDNGVLLYIAFDDRKMFIQAGSGLEAVLPDAMLKRIIENVITPSFRDGQYYQGIDRGTDIMIQMVSGEYTADEQVETKGMLKFVIILFFIILFLVIFISVAIYRCKKRGDCNDGGGYYGGGTYSSGGGWFIGGGGFGSGGSSGGFGGGGFGGFGGGGFSGGGAGGGW